jgi:hypothetical protein
MTEEQRIARIRVMHNDGPIKISYEGYFCHACGQSRPMSEKPWSFWWRHPQDPNGLGSSYNLYFNFRTFQEACSKIREIFSEGSPWL